MRLRHAHLPGSAVLLAVMVILHVNTIARAQAPPWEIRTDPLTLIDCGLINAENVELIVLADTGELVIVSEDGVDVLDTVILDTEVDVVGNVFFSGVQVGQIRFAEDATGLTTLWWLDVITDRVYQYDLSADQPILGTFLPSDIVGLDCDPCPVWDVPEDCGGVAVGGDVLPPIDSGNAGDTVTIPPVVINFCGTNTALSMMLTFAGLVGTSLVRRPRY